MTTEQGPILLRLARQAIEASFEGRPVVVPPDPWLQAPGAAFVTLRQRADDALRGCIGSLEAREPLGDAVVAAAIGAAFRDPRFSPLAARELRLVRLDVSVLSPLQSLAVTHEADARAHLARVRPGVLLQHGRRRGVLLPKVWESVPDAGDFLRLLKRKAGLPVSFWADSVELSVFTCDECAEADDRHAEAR